MSGPGSLTVRYCAQFDADRTAVQQYAEFCLSVASVKLYLAPYVDVSILLYALPGGGSTLTAVLEQLGLAYEVRPLDDSEDAAFADSIEHCDDVDRICIRRMLQDARLLEPSSHRLLVGADCFFLGVPQEVVAFAWASRPSPSLLYARDLYSFGGVPYRLRHWRSPLLEGLLGDFYCLGPGVSMDPGVVKACLRLIDSWPADESRYDPTLPGPVRSCEQQAAAMLLAQYDAEALPATLYSHLYATPEVVMLHTHDLDDVKRFAPAALGQLFASVMGALHSGTWTSLRLTL